MNKPNFRTINRFRSEKLTDGRFESVANKYTFVWKGSVEKNKSKLIVKVDAILKKDLKQRTDRILKKMNETELTNIWKRWEKGTVIAKLIRMPHSCT